MLRTFDAKSYTDLLVRYQPKPIANEAEMEPLRSILNSVVKRCYGEDTRRATAR